MERCCAGEQGRGEWQEADRKNGAWLSPVEMWFVCDAFGVMVWRDDKEALTACFAV